MSVRLLVENLAGHVSNLRLEQLVSRHGQVNSARIILDETSGSSQGSGYVLMGSDEDAQKAVAALNGLVVDGLPLAVSILPIPPEEVQVLRPRYGNGRSGGLGVRSGRRS
jgi:RNA recognition motif-containing protein